MSNLLTYTDCKDLCHTICQSFYYGREKVFCKNFFKTCITKYE